EYLPFRFDFTRLATETNDRYRRAITISSLEPRSLAVLESTCGYATLFDLGVRGRARRFHWRGAADLAQGTCPLCRHGTCDTHRGAPAGHAAQSAQASGVRPGSAQRGRVVPP